MKEQAGPQGKTTHYIYRKSGNQSPIEGLINWEVNELRASWSDWWKSKEKMSVGLAAICGAVEHLRAKSVTLVGFDSHITNVGNRYGKGTGAAHNWRAERIAANDLVEVFYGRHTMSDEMTESALQARLDRIFIRFPAAAGVK